MTLLARNVQWEGMYRLEEINDPCSLTVHSHTSVSFIAEHIIMDMKVSSDDNVTVTFNESSVWHSTVHESSYTDLSFVGVFQKTKTTYSFVGNISSCQRENIGTISLSPNAIRGRSNDETRLRYGLAIGIPVCLAILLTIASVFILKWGIKKGYLRHVPWAYKYFTNPKRGQADFEINNPEYSTESGQPEVHI
ncbi:unnamed protein product [Candidula unifasciata]|uniref:Uncharacterized protein n=1 Tax=Candidula unifasciata TaxID=100452 RepID=A0A8S3Z5Z7_9EUPU|nr:unnamed protein product [Candidula unifasciata]